ncbi:MAG: hypothetical protein AB7Q37_09820 [Pyrinomonadaceae bacterium]
MGVITIEIPQGIKRTYQIRSKARAQKILDSLDSARSAENVGESEGPTKNGNRAKEAGDLESVLDSVTGMWAARKESTEALAKKLRDGWDRSDAK